jgi:hypothetical protein
MAAMVAITGNTFPVKDAIKALGGRWNADAKAWMVPPAKAAEAQALVAGAPAPRKYTASKHPRTGCSCGSREGLERDSDCSSCQHDY